MKLISVLSFLGLMIIPMMGCLPSNANLSKGTPSVPQGPSISIQEEHDLREANKFDRYTEHIKVTHDRNLDLTLEEFSVSSTEDYVTNLDLELLIHNKQDKDLNIYDVIFNEFYLIDEESSKKIIIDKKTDHLQIGAKQSKVVSISLQVPWFEGPKPRKLSRVGNYFNVEVIASDKKINVNEFFIAASKAHSYDDLPREYQVLTSTTKKIKLK